MAGWVRLLTFSAHLPYSGGVLSVQTRHTTDCTADAPALSESLALFCMEDMMAGGPHILWHPPGIHLHHAGHPGSHDPLNFDIAGSRKAPRPCRSKARYPWNGNRVAAAGGKNFQDQAKGLQWQCTSQSAAYLCLSVKLQRMLRLPRVVSKWQLIGFSDTAIHRRPIVPSSVVWDPKGTSDVNAKEARAQHWQHPAHPACAKPP